MADMTIIMVHQMFIDPLTIVFALLQCGPITGPRAACGPPLRFQWPAEEFRKILPIWNMLKSV